MSAAGTGVFLIATLAACSASVAGLGGSTTSGPRPAGGAANGGGEPAGASVAGGDGAVVATSSGAGSVVARGSGCRAQQWADAWPYLDQPADPWLAVVDGRPARVSLPTDRGQGLQKPGTICDAAHDHCLRDCTWLVTQLPAISARSQATPYHVDTSGAFVTAMGHADTHPQPGFVAYRTVPVTRANLRVGVLVMAVAAPMRDAGGHGTTRTDTDAEPLGAFWDAGTVESIDWDAGTLRLTGRREPYFLSAARIAVLRYADGGTVEAIAGVDARAPSVAEVIAPGRRVAANDPWSAVGTDGQPIAFVEGSALSTFDDRCTAEADHCLRPGTWFVDGSRHPLPARWTGNQFVFVDDAGAAVGKPGVAYRTRPATAAELRPGQRVLVYDNGTVPASEREAHSARNWAFVEVGEVDLPGGRFTARDSDRRYLVGSARVLVLYWLAGDKAANVE